MHRRNGLYRRLAAMEAGIRERSIRRPKLLPNGLKRGRRNPRGLHQPRPVMAVVTAVAITATEINKPK